jgi:hypothetical protein
MRLLHTGMLHLHLQRSNWCGREISFYLDLMVSELALRKRRERHAKGKALNVFRILPSAST